LGRVRLQLGDLPGAEEAFLEARQVGWDPEPGLALVRLAQGDVALAAASIHNALDHPLNVPSKELPPNTDLRRAPLLAARVEIEVAAGDLIGARDAADDLARVAAAYESRALAASAAMADGRVRLAAGDTAGARQAFETACQLWTHVGAPFETALARTGLAQAHRAAGVGIGAPLGLRAVPPSWGAGQADGGQPNPNVFHQEGDYWSISFEEHTAALRDLKGLHYLARLLAHPGREFHVLDLVAGGVARAAIPTGAADPELTISGQSDSGPLLDAQAEAERDFLIRELSRAVGLSGRARRAGSPAERARVSVTRAVRHAMSQIRQHNPPLGEHLDRAIRTGTYCVYLPDSRITASWMT
jgi:tetratricopeptide (TPR) repeat protein